MSSNIGFNKSEYIRLLQEACNNETSIEDPVRNEIYDMLLTHLEIDKNRFENKTDNGASHPSSFRAVNIILNFEVSVNFDYTFKSGILKFNIEYFNITGYFNKDKYINFKLSGDEVVFYYLRYASMVDATYPVDFDKRA